MRKLGPVAFVLSILINFSFTVKPEKVGVLLLAHGGSSSWNETIRNATQTIEQNYIVEVAFGMANPISIQQGINNLESQGVTKIVVVPLFISSYSPIIRQNEYLLGLRDTLADPPMIMMDRRNENDDIIKGKDHNSSPNNPSHSGSNNIKKSGLKPLEFKSQIILTKPLNDHPLVAEIIFERISDLSVNPGNETILIVAHGPSDEQDNKNWVKIIDNLADQIRTIQAENGAKFKQIFGLTVRDDADPAIYEQAKEQLRTLVSQSGKDGDVIVIPLLLSKGGVEAQYVKRLEGLNYKWNGKTLLPHQNITKFIEVSVENALKE